MAGPSSGFKVRITVLPDTLTPEKERLKQNDASAAVVITWWKRLLLLPLLASG